MEEHPTHELDFVWRSWQGVLSSGQTFDVSSQNQGFRYRNLKFIGGHREIG